MIALSDSGIFAVWNSGILAWAAQAWLHGTLALGDADRDQARAGRLRRRCILVEHGGDVVDEDVYPAVPFGITFCAENMSPR